MIKQLKELLNHLDAVLDPELQEQIELRHRRALDWMEVDRLPLVLSYPPDDDWPFLPFRHSEIFDHPEKMLYNELVHAFDTSIAMRGQIDDDLPLTVRANFGTVLIASMLGAQVEQVGENPPWLRPADSKAGFESYLNCDPNDFSRGWLPQVEKTIKVYQEILADYPKLYQMIRIVLPDLQGPLDNASVMRGADFFLELITERELTDQAMRLCTAAQVNFARHLQPELTDTMNGYSHQHAVMIRGNILIRNDSTVMISPDMYRQQIAEYDSMILNGMGGGSIHSCGKIDHVIEEFMKIPDCRSIDIGQPELNDLDLIYAMAKQHKVSLIRITVPQEQLVSGLVLKRFPTGVSLVYRAGSFAEARHIMKQYRRASGT
jgi:hypothetical protein